MQNTPGVWRSRLRSECPNTMDTSASETSGFVADAHERAQVQERAARCGATKRSQPVAAVRLPLRVLFFLYLIKMLKNALD